MIQILTLKSVVLYLLILAFDAKALSCPLIFLEDQFRDNEHIFLILITSANFHPSSDQHLQIGYVNANFEVLEVFKGDPEKVPHIVIPVFEDEKDWPVEVPLGRRRILLQSRDGPVEWNRCSKGIRVSECAVYEFRRYAGRLNEPNDQCENRILWVRFKKLGITPTSKFGDLEELRLEWKARFGEWPN